MEELFLSREYFARSNLQNEQHLEMNAHSAMSREEKIIFLNKKFNRLDVSHGKSATVTWDSGGEKLRLETYKDNLIAMKPMVEAES